MLIKQKLLKNIDDITIGNFENSTLELFNEPSESSLGALKLIIPNEELIEKKGKFSIVFYISVKDEQYTIDGSFDVDLFYIRNDSSIYFYCFENDYLDIGKKLIKY